MKTYGLEVKMKEWIAVLRAADTAARWHTHQRRKGIAQEPYINHLLEVASLVAEATGGTNPALGIDKFREQNRERFHVGLDLREDEWKRWHLRRHAIARQRYPEEIPCSREFFPCYLV
jgi:hypothetical protein